MKKDQFQQILDHHSRLFINNIAKELEESHARLFEEFGFPMFGVTSKDYHEQVYFQSYLESYTRKMINSILQEVFNQFVPNQFIWPEQDYGGIYNGYTNIECEEQFGFEFIDTDKKVGYRYTFFQYDTVDKLLKMGNVEKIELIVWECADNTIGFEYEDDRVKVILIWDLFQDLFYDIDGEDLREIYDLFIKHISDAVEKANAMISLVTLPGFTPSYLHKTRKEIVSDIRKEVKSIDAFFVKHKDYKTTQEDSKKLILDYHLANYFIDNNMELAFVGTSRCAKSFLTSEYLYKHFTRNPLFDYTPIVSGYLKSIEQLLDFICKSHQNHYKTQEDLNNYTMGSYIEYIKNHVDVFRGELQAASMIIVNCLISYKVENRNKLFHKHYFEDWERVLDIRKNTLFLYVALLGAINLEYIPNGIKGFGQLKTEYDDLFEIMEKENGRFLVVLNGKEYHNMVKKQRVKGLCYNRNGIITNTIELERFIYDHYETVELTPKNMPSSIWREDSYGKKRVKIW